MNFITNIYSNIQPLPNNHSGLEAWALSKEFNLSFLGKKNSRNSEVDNYYDISDIDPSSIKSLFIQLSQPNFFGGVIATDTIEKVAKISECNCHFYILCNDPRIKPTNPAVELNKRSVLFDSSVERKWDLILKNCTYLFPGKDLNKFYGSNDYSKFHQLNWFKLIFAYKLTPKINQVEKLFDVVYYGDRRGSYREKQLIKYMPNNEKSLLIAFKQDKLNDVTFVKKQKHDDLIKTLDSCKVSLILSDKEHENNVITFRLYETLASNCLAAIPIEFDPNREIIKDEVLREILYVKNIDDVKNLVNMYDIELIKRQHEEFLRLTKLL